MKIKTSISISLYNSDKTVASINGDDGMDTVHLCSVKGQTAADQKKCCQKAAEVLGELAAKFTLLSREPEAANVSAQEKVNKSK